MRSSPPSPLALLSSAAVLLSCLRCSAGSAGTRARRSCALSPPPRSEGESLGADLRRRRCRAGEGEGAGDGDRACCCVSPVLSGGAYGTAGTASCRAALPSRAFVCRIARRRLSSSPMLPMLMLRLSAGSPRGRRRHCAAAGLSRPSDALEDGIPMGGFVAGDLVLKAKARLCTPRFGPTIAKSE